MDQLKEFLKQAVKYRFWIAVGLSALLPMIAYLVASGSLQGETTKQEADITGSQKGVAEYNSGAVVNKDYKPLVEEKTVVLTKDVNASWRELYGRQAPLLTWPAEVEKNLKDWGRKFPEKIDPSQVRDTIDAYMRVYAQQVSGVYKSFHPWDPEAGEGIVVAPPEVALLQPATFDPSKPPLPGLGRIWSAQEKLWIQGTVLDVIRQVNDKAKAKDWETAVVKQIEALIVASPLAQDQRSAAKGDALEPAKEIVDPSLPVAEKPAAESGGSARFARGVDGGIGGGGAATKGEDVYYLASPNPDQYQIVPIYLSVLIDQASIPDLLVEFQNSPMGIQVMDMELKRPDERVRKPLKGVAPAFGGGMAGNMSMGGGRGMRLGGGGGGRGMADGGEAGYPNMGSGAAAYNGAGGGRGGRGPMDGTGGVGATRTPTKTGEKNVENANRTNAKGEPAAKKDDAPPPISKFSDPYFNVVELRIYGQARFYQPPPPEEPSSEPSASASASASAATPEPAKVDEPAKKDEPAKVDAPKPDDVAKKVDAPKPDEPKPAEPAKKDEPKAEAPKVEPPKAEPPKADAPKS